MSVEARSTNIPGWVRRVCRGLCTASEEAILAKYADYIIKMISGEVEHVTVDTADVDTFCRLVAKLRIAVRCPMETQNALQGVESDDIDVIEFY